MSIRTMAAQPLEATPRSNNYVTIQMRRGLESQMDKSKFLPAEFGATTDTKKLFFAFGAGDVQQLATYQNLEGLMAQALAGLEEEYLGSITQATQNAINATSQASSAATAANQAADEANEIIDAFKEAVDGTVISDSSASSSTAYSSQKIENDFLKKNGNGSNVTVTFQQAAERAGIQSGDSLAVAFGKLAKFFTDIQSYVFSPPVNNLLSEDTSRPLSAAMGKQLQEAVESLNSALEPKLTSLKSADENYFSVNGGHCTHIGNMYIFHIDISVMKQIQANYDTGNGKGPRVVMNLPFTWAYTFNFSATLNDHTTLILVGNDGENTLRLHTTNPLLPTGRKIIANFSFPDNYVS